MADDLISTIDAAAIIGVTPQAVRKQIARGTFPAQRVGRWFRVHRGDALAYRDARKARLRAEIRRAG